MITVRLINHSRSDWKSLLFHWYSRRCDSSTAHNSGYVIHQMRSRRFSSKLVALCAPVQNVVDIIKQRPPEVNLRRLLIERLVIQILDTYHVNVVLSHRGQNEHSQVFISCITSCNGRGTWCQSVCFRQCLQQLQTSVCQWNIPFFSCFCWKEK